MGAIDNIPGSDRGDRLEEPVKLLTIIFLVAFSVFLISIYHTELQEYVFYMHFLYLPIVLATFWWGKKGIAIAPFLGGAVIALAVLSGSTQETVFSSLVEAALFVIVAALVGTLSDEEERALEKELCFKRDTAHYFFNPICIAEGNIELAHLKTSGEAERAKGDGARRRADKKGGGQRRRGRRDTRVAPVSLWKNERVATAAAVFLSGPRYRGARPSG